MAFKELNSLDTDTTISLGGTNRKTGKANPNSIEGYYLGKKQITDNKKKSGVTNIYIFQTSKGNVGVWGKTNLDNKMQSVGPGVMVRVTFSGMKPTPNGEMYTYKVEQDQDNVLDDVPVQASSVEEAYEPAESFSNDEDDNQVSYEAEEQDDFVPQVNTAQAAKERQAKAMALLSKKSAVRK